MLKKYWSSFHLEMQVMLKVRLVKLNWMIWKRLLKMQRYEKFFNASFQLIKIRQARSLETKTTWTTSTEMDLCWKRWPDRWLKYALNKQFFCHTTTAFLINNQVPLFERVNTFTWSQLIPNVSNRPQFCLKSSRFSGRKLFSVPKADCSAAI